MNEKASSRATAITTSSGFETAECDALCCTGKETKVQIAVEFDPHQYMASILYHHVKTLTVLSLTL